MLSPALSLPLSVMAAYSLPQCWRSLRSPGPLMDHPVAYLSPALPYHRTSETNVASGPVQGTLRDKVSTTIQESL